MASPKKSAKQVSALVVLADAQIGHVANFDIKAVTQAVRSEMEKLADQQKHASLRGLRLGIVLYRVKEALGHGKFMSWVKKNFTGRYTHRHATRFMKLARYFVEATRADMPEVNALSSMQLELSITSEETLLAKAVKFVGDKTLTELLEEAEESENGAPKGKKHATVFPSVPPGEIIFDQFTEGVRMLKMTAEDPAALIHLTRLQREQMKDDLWALYETYRANHEKAFKKTPGKS